MFTRMVWVFAGLFLLNAGCSTAIRATADFEQHVPWAPYQQVVVSSHNGAIDVRIGDRKDVRISGTKQVSGPTLSAATADLERVVIHTAAASDEPGTLRVELRFPPELASRGVGAQLKIEVPVPCAARVTTGNGPITVRGLVGSAYLDTSNGAIVATAIDGPLTAATSNGGIVLEGVTEGAEARTSNGNIRARKIRGPVALATTNGSIDFGADTASTGSIALHTTNGGIRAALPVGFAADFDLQTSNGSIDVRIAGATMEEAARRRTALRGKLNGGGVPVLMRSSNGSILVTER